MKKWPSGRRRQTVNLLVNSSRWFESNFFHNLIRLTSPNGSSPRFSFSSQNKSTTANPLTSTRPNLTKGKMGLIPFSRTLPVRGLRLSVRFSQFPRIFFFLLSLARVVPRRQPRSRSSVGLFPISYGRFNSGIPGPLFAQWLLSEPRSPNPAVSAFSPFGRSGARFVEYSGIFRYLDVRSVSSLYSNYLLFVYSLATDSMAGAYHHSEYHNLVMRFNRQRLTLSLLDPFQSRNHFSLRPGDRKSVV